MQIGAKLDMDANSDLAHEFPFSLCKLKKELVCEKSQQIVKQISAKIYHLKTEAPIVLRASLARFSLSPLVTCQRLCNKIRK